MNEPAARSPWARLGVLLGLFVTLTVLGILWAMPSRAALRSEWRALVALDGGTVLLVTLLAAGVVAAEMWRFIVIGRALGVRITPRAAFDATIANNFFSWITPGAALGEPAGIYMLGRHGVPLDAALLISFGKFATSFAFIMGLVLALVGLGYGPSIAMWALLPLVVGIGDGVLVIGLFLLGAVWPEATTRRIEAVERWLVQRRPFRGPRVARAVAALGASSRSAVERLAHFRRSGAVGTLQIALSHVIYYAAYSAVLVALAAGYGAPSLAAVVPISVVFQGFTYIAPTPGASGLAEAAANAFFGGVVPGQGAAAVVLLFRAFTTYLHVVVGVVYLPAVGALRGIMTAARRTSS